MAQAMTSPLASRENRFNEGGFHLRGKLVLTGMRVIVPYVFLKCNYIPYICPITIQLDFYQRDLHEYWITSLYPQPPWNLFSLSGTCAK
jgi:hypothetical protein